LLFKKIKEKSNIKLGEILNINQGIVSGCDKGFVLKKYDEKFKK
jgi:adenine-specific DNA-methyltransferase